MASTLHLNINPDFYTTKKECEEKQYETFQLNNRYKNFVQRNFTAGDENQFEEYRDKTNGQLYIPNINLTNNIFNGGKKKSVWVKNKNLNSISVRNTFQYIFHKFKKGIFIKIKNNKLAVFLPFSKNNFTNEWSHLIKINPIYGDIYGFVKYINKMNNRYTNTRHINKFTETWYSNNCLVRYEYPISEGDTNVPIMKDMFETLCKSKKVPDLEFFINRRDFPIIKKDGTEPYNHIYNSEKHKLLSHNYDTYSPILSMTTTDKYSDIPIPTGDDWSRISFKENKLFPKQCKDYLDEFKCKWSDKKPTAVFRGTSTGSGVNINTNMRLKISLLSYKHNLNSSDKIPLIDAGITKFNLRPRKLMGEKYLKTIDINKLKEIGVKLINKLTPEEQSKYKYIVNIDGHVSAFRLSLELGMNCCILLVESKYKLWFENMLKPYVHYVPIKADLSNLISQIEWCRQNDDKCEIISIKSRKFYMKYLQKDGILDYLQKLIVDLKNSTGLYFYNSKSLLQLQLDKEIKMIVKTQKYPDKYKGKQHTDFTTLDIYRDYRRTYGFLKSLMWILNIGRGKDKNFKNFEIIYENNAKTVNVKKALFLGCPVTIKKSKLKEKENIHEIFIGIKCINKLLKYVPNFSYMFGYYHTSFKREKATVIMEYIQGKTLCEWIKTEFNMKEFLFILIQICLTLELSQKLYGFVHWDLTPWNIIINRQLDFKIIDYMLDTKNIFRIKTNIIPVIIDYGKSHVIYEHKHYGYIHMYKTSTIQDIISLLLNSLYDISLNKNLNSNIINEIILLSNFLTGNRYMKKIYKTGKMGMGGLRYSYGKAKKYSELINSKKYDLEKLKPIDLILYIKNNFNYTFTLKQIQNPNFLVDNPIQVTDYIFSKSSTEKLESFQNIFKTFLDCDDVKKITKNIILKYHIVQILYNNLTTVWNKMNDFWKEEKGDKKNLEESKKLYEKSINKLENYINDEDYNFHFKLDVYKYSEIKTNNLTYTIDTFLYPEKIKKLLKEYENYDMYDLSEYIRIIELVLVNNGKFKINRKKYYFKYFINLLSINTLNMKIQKTNKITLIKSSHILYSNNSKELLDGIVELNNKYKYLTKYLTKIKLEN